MKRRSKLKKLSLVKLKPEWAEVAYEFMLFACENLPAPAACLS
ncbi:MAG: hypothetical protein RL368_232 [Pseudomonadota bacterium]|jgi:hypothetical protein